MNKVNKLKKRYQWDVQRNDRLNKDKFIIRKIQNEIDGQKKKFTRKV